MYQFQILLVCHVDHIFAELPLRINGLGWLPCGQVVALGTLFYSSYVNPSSNKPRDGGRGGHGRHKGKRKKNIKSFNMTH